MNRLALLIIFAVLDLGCILLALTLGSPITIAQELSIPFDYKGASFFTCITFILSYYTLEGYQMSRR